MYFDRIGKTIGAVATAPGSTIGIIRVSGQKAFEVTSKLTGIPVSKMKPNTTRLASIRDNSDNILDNCLLLFFKGPKSFTGEDIVEFHLHGSSLHAQEILSLIVSENVEPAMKGEFSFRAVLNNKMDIHQASNLSSMIAANDKVTLSFARKEAFENRFFSFISSLKPSWERLYSLSTAIIDFPEQITQFLPESEVTSLCTETREPLAGIMRNTEKLDVIKSLSVVIAGKPNAGKSSLFNLISERDRAIVSDEAGTTRDYISETVSIENIPIKLIDTAGIRKGESEIEKIGIQKSVDLLGQNDLAILLLDGSRPLSEEDDLIIEKLEGSNYITVINKTDLGIVFDSSRFKDPVIISAKSGEGTDLLMKRVGEKVKNLLPDISEPVLTQSWQRETAETLLETIDELEEQIEFGDIEIISVLIKDCYTTILKLLGEEDKVDVYDLIFSSFCLGK